MSQKLHLFVVRSIIFAILWVCFVSSQFEVIQFAPPLVKGRKASKQAFIEVVAKMATKPKWLLSKTRRPMTLLDPEI